MRRLALLLYIVLALVPAFAQNSPVNPLPYVHQIDMETVLSRASCSATAIGPFALLTASHCEMASSLIKVDGHRAKIVGTPIRDAYDHSIYLLQMEEPFAQYAEVRTLGTPNLGETAILIGNPGPLHAFYRSGQFAGIHKDADTGDIAWMFNFSIAPGDSGAGIFDADGVLYAVSSYMEDAGSDGMHLWVTMSFPLYFTDSQIDDARKFSSTPLPKEKKAFPQDLLDLFFPKPEGQ
jgi:hypothetical protein